MELYDNIIENNPVNESEDYNDFVNRRRSNKKSIRTKVTTLMENGEVHSEVMGTNVSEENVNVNTSSCNGSNASGDVDEKVSNASYVNDKEELDKGTGDKEKETKSTNIKNNDVKGEENTVFGMKPVYGYTLVTIVALVGIVAAVKILKNNKSK